MTIDRVFNYKNAQKMKLCFATNNPNKLHEIKTALAGKIEIVGLKDIGCQEDIPETGDTLKANSLIKASYVHEKYDIDCFADDTGLEIDALNSEPGVYSARYAGEESDAEKNMAKVLQNLGGETNRAARFKTVITLIQNDETHYFEGIVSGTIRKEKSGSEGFGYDPIFQPDGYDITFAEMPLEEKNQISHRGKAVKKLVEFLQKK